MSCSCGCGCLSGCGCRIIVLPENPAASYGMENINLTGVGVYDNTSGTTFQMRGVASANSSLTVTLDAGNNTILLTLDLDTVVDDLPQATTTQRGVGETATDAEAIAKTSITNFVTPSNFAAMDATTTFKGFIEIATNAETIAGVSTTLAVTPAGIAAAIASGGFVETTFADAAVRVTAQPKFAGSIGYQLDTEQPYIGNSQASGDWNLILADTASVQEIGAGLILDISAAGATFDGDHNGDFTFLDINNLSITSAAGILIDSSNITFSGSQFFNLGTNVTQFAIDNALVPQNSVLTTKTGAFASSQLISTFLSTSNVQTGYTTFSNPSTIRTCDTATVTLQQLAQIVGTLITDLKAVKLPAT